MYFISDISLFWNCTF